MLLIVTLALVLVAAVTLVMGIFGNHLQPIYISIVSSFAAAILLGVISRLNRRKPSDVTTADAPAPLPADEPEPARAERSPSGHARPGPTAQLPAVGPDGSPVPKGTGGPGPRDEHWAHQQQWAQRQQWAQQEGGQPEAAVPEAAVPEAAPAAPTARDASASPGIFPIEDYDDLRRGEILPLLDELDEGELTEVRAHEYDGERRSAVLDRIDERLGRPRAAAQPEPASPPGWLVAGPASGSPTEPQPEAPWPAAGAVSGSLTGPQRAVSGSPTGSQPAAAWPPTQSQPAAGWPAAGAAGASAASAAAAGPGPGAGPAPQDGHRDDGGTTSPRRPPGGAEAPSQGGTPFPIENYDELRVAQILLMLTQLDGGELERVAAHERDGANRNTILNRIDRLQKAAPPASSKDAAPA